MADDTAVTERWAWVPGWEDHYQVSDLGRVRSVDRVLKCGGHERRHRGRILSQSWAGSTGSNRGHLKVQLSLGGISTYRYVHQLVLEAFDQPRPDGLEGCHKNGDASDNRYLNLKWGTTSENRYDSVRHGTHPKTRRRACPLGHRLVAPNLRNDPTGHGYRRCLACLYAYNATRMAEGRGQFLDKKAEAHRQYALIMSRGQTRV